MKILRISSIIWFSPFFLISLIIVVINIYDMFTVQNYFRIFNDWKILFIVSILATMFFYILIRIEKESKYSIILYISSFLISGIYLLFYYIYYAFAKLLSW